MTEPRETKSASQNSSHPSSQRVAPDPSASALAPPSASVQVLPWPRRWVQWREKNAFWGRYSVGKLRAFAEYQRDHAPSREWLVLVLSPLPLLLLLILLLLIPLDDPSLGAAHNWRSFARSIVSHISASFCVTLAVKQALELDHREYPFWKCALMAVLASGVNEFAWQGIAFAWRFPVPFRELLCANTWLVWFIALHYLHMRDAFARKRERLRIYLPVFTAQFSLFYVYLALAVAFSYCELLGQVLLVLLVPPVKVIVKRRVWRLARRLEDLSTDVTVCVVEMSAAIFQAVIMIYARSVAIPWLVFAVDIVQAMAEIGLNIDRSGLAEGEDVLATGCSLLARLTNETWQRRQQAYTAELQEPPPQRRLSSALSFGGSRSVAQRLTFPKIDANRDISKQNEQDVSTKFIDFHAPLELTSAAQGEPASKEQPPIIIDGLSVTRTTDARQLVQLLRLLFASEMLLFIEFMELWLAVTHLVLLVVAHELPGGKYLIPLMNLPDDEAFRSAVTHAAWLAGLEALSFGVVYCLLQRKSGVASLGQVALVLRKYWMTVQGKIGTCLLILLNLATLQQGIDFTFQFEYKAREP
ncbi:hypothetical protein P43SY_004114 [Pythium insidiosum]|uniref:Transmembrane protein n=1 Tax=Pythium insidiosum TaxID=114742 RepID=A0AAD5M2V4_PYTIN|nr:hypothetical protein P43SY_004114 [Pythium insidiosum]